MSWKNALNDLIKGINLLIVEADGHFPENLFKAGPQHDDFIREMARIGRMKQTLKLRKCTLVKSEMGLRIEHEAFRQTGAAAEVLVRHRLIYEQHGTVRESEMLQYYLIEFEQVDDDRWVVTAWQPIDQPEHFEELDGGSMYNSFDEENLYGQWQPSRGYDRIKVQRYAETWWNSHNPVYPKIYVDCTNFASQCLHAGGMPLKFTGRRDSGWWYKSNVWSYSWAVAHSLRNYLVQLKGPISTQLVNEPQQLTIGDIICYDWDGNGRWEHNTVVVANDPFGMPLVNAHTNNSRMRYWNYHDSYAWTERTKYSFIHIV